MRLFVVFVLTFGLAVAGDVQPADRRPSVDLVLLFDKTEGTEWAIRRTQIESLRPNDRVAVMTFTGKTRLRQKFTNDRQKLSFAIRRLSVNMHLVSRVRDKDPVVHLFEALLDACRLFDDLDRDPARKRDTIVVFGTEDTSSKPSIDEVRKALTDRQIRLFATAIRRFDLSRWQDPHTQTPPTIPGRYPPVETGWAPLPNITLDTVSKLASATGGEAVSGKWNLPAVLERARHAPRPPG